MKDIDSPPVTASRPLLVIVVLGLFLVLAAGVTNAYYGMHTGNSHPLSPLTNQQIISRLAAAQSPEPPTDQWVESRDGDGALEIEDTNGTAIIYFDEQSRTRLLCIDHNGCYHLRGHRESIK